MFNYFCNQSCLMDFITTHLQSIVAIAPRREALETPIKVGVETRTDYFGHEYKTKVISKIDND